MERQISRERRRRYSDSAHILIDSPESPPIKARSLDDLDRHHPDSFDSRASSGKISIGLASPNTHSVVPHPPLAQPSLPSPPTPSTPPLSEPSTSELSPDLYGDQYSCCNLILLGPIRHSIRYNRTNTSNLVAGSLDRISDDSDVLFDETTELLKNVASELRTYESFGSDIEDDDEFFVYSEADLNRGANLLTQYTVSSSRRS